MFVFQRFKSNTTNTEASPCVPPGVVASLGYTAQDTVLGEGEISLPESIWTVGAKD